MARASSTVMPRIRAIRVPDRASGETVTLGLERGPGAGIVAMGRASFRDRASLLENGWHRDGEVSDSPAPGDRLTVARPCWTCTSFLAPSRTPDATVESAFRQPRPLTQPGHPGGSSPVTSYR